MKNLEEKLFNKREPITLENVKSWLSMKLMPREDYGKFWLDHWVAEGGIELYEYINKKSEKIERRAFSQGENLMGEIIYDSKTGERRETRKYYEETGELEEKIEYDEKTGEPKKIIKFSEDGKIQEDVDVGALSEIQKDWNRLVIEAVRDKARSLTDEEIERLKTILIFDNKIMREKSAGRDPDIKH